ncbi:MAG: ATP-binding protein [Tetrasphaera sp.]
MDKASTSGAKDASERPKASRPKVDLDEFGGTIGVGNARTIRAPWRGSSIPRVRTAICRDLAAREVDEETIDEVAIVASELVANALRHAKPLHDNTVRVHWTEKNGVVEVDVTDGGGETAPKAMPKAVFAPSGRGLRIVRSLAHEWGVSEKKGSITVWASLGGPSRRRA